MSSGRNLLVMIALLAAAAMAPHNYLKGIIEADRALARTARLKGLEWTYERTFSADALVLTDKLEPAADWLKALDEKPGDKMFWDVNRAEISAQGEFGYTAGSWTLKNGSNYKDGDYVRVWEKRGKDWKLVFEADTATDLPRVPSGNVSVPAPPKKAKGRVKARPPAPPTEDVQKAITDAETSIADGSAPSASYLGDAFFLRTGEPAAVGYANASLPDAEKTDDEKFIVDKAQDLACSFGYLVSDTHRWPFLRIWRRSPGKGWLVTLEFVGQPAKSV